MSIKLYNSLSGRKEEFQPYDPEHITMYVCGPTVYDRPHIGNARAVVVYDVLYRLLKKQYPKVTYVRNITDVDDKINAAAKANNEPISELTKRVTSWFHDDMAELNNLLPDIEPRATQEIQPIIELIERIIANGYAYVSQGHVLFSVNNVGKIGNYSYGKLSGKKLDDLIAGARVEVASYKKDAGDFVLWKPANEGDDPSSVFESPWGNGRPGWHIECSAMSTKYLGENFDIHGGGADLKFPHHENEIAQSCCGNKGSSFAKYWVHNGFLTVNGEKMSKSKGNFITVQDLLDRGVKGEVIRYVLLSTKYNEPLDWSEKRLSDAKKNLGDFYRKIEYIDEDSYEEPDGIADDYMLDGYPKGFIDALCNDLNTPTAISLMHGNKSPIALRNAGRFLGFFEMTTEEWFGGEKSVLYTEIEKHYIDELIEQRNIAKQDKNWGEADKIRERLTNMGIILEDTPSGTKWRNK